MVLNKYSRNFWSCQSFGIRDKIEMVNLLALILLRRGMTNPLRVSLDNIIPLTEARDHFSQIVAEVQTDKLYVLTKGGKPAVAIIDVKYLEMISGGEIKSEHIEREIQKDPEKVGRPTMLKHEPVTKPEPPAPQESLTFEPDSKLKDEVKPVEPFAHKTDTLQTPSNPIASTSAPVSTPVPTPTPLNPPTPDPMASPKPFETETPTNNTQAPTSSAPSPDALTSATPNPAPSAPTSTPLAPPLANNSDSVIEVIPDHASSAPAPKPNEEDKPGPAQYSGSMGSGGQDEPEDMKLD